MHTIQYHCIRLQNDTLYCITAYGCIWLKGDTLYSITVYGCRMTHFSVSLYTAAYGCRVTHCTLLLYTDAGGTCTIQYYYIWLQVDTLYSITAYSCIYLQVTIQYHCIQLHMAAR